MAVDGVGVQAPPRKLDRNPATPPLSPIDHISRPTPNLLGEFETTNLRKFREHLRAFFLDGKSPRWWRPSALVGDLIAF